MTKQATTINNDSNAALSSFLIDDVRADANANLLIGPHGEVRLEPRVMEILCQLADSSGDVVLREQMLDEYGSDEGITRAISILRKSFKKVSGDVKFIETIPKRGYRLLVSAVHDNEPRDFSISAIEDHKYVASLAVLPFTDLSEDQDQGYFSDGVTQEIMNALANLYFLKVCGRSSSFAFKGSNASISHIAKTLNVTHVLEGSVRKYGERLRISVQLVEAPLDNQIASRTFDGTLEEIFDLQGKIASEIQQTLQNLFNVQDTGESKSFRSANQLTDCKLAYNEFLIGRHLMYELSGQRTIPRAIQAYQNAIDQDPNFASAWAHLAIANFTLPEYSTTENWREHIQSARTQTEHALSLDPNVAWSHRALAGILSYDLKFDQAIHEYREALRLEPNDPELLFTNGYIFSAVGLHQQAQGMMEDALDREPLLGSWYGALGTTYFASGDFEKAEELFKKSFECNFGYGAILQAQLMTHLGKPAEALALMKKNFDGLGPVLQSQLKSALVRKVTYSAFFKRSKLARKVMDVIFTSRMKKEEVQPSLGNIIGFLMIGSPEKFFEHVLNKPNPYVGFSLSRIWEPTEESKAVRMHPNFPKFAESIGLVKIWQEFGWPQSIVPHAGTDGSNGCFDCK